MLQVLLHAGHFLLQTWILHDGLHQSLQLRTLLLGHRIHQLLHGGRLLAHMLDQVLERTDVVPEVVAPFVHELLEPRIFPAVPSLEHVVQIAHHLPRFRDLFRRHLAERLLHALEGLIHHLLLQLIHQLLELLPGLRIHEVVLLQPANLAGGIARQRIQLLVSLFGNGIEQVAKTVLIRPAPLPRRFVRASARLPSSDSLDCVRVVEPLLNSGPLGIDDVLDSLANVVEHRTEVVALRLFLTRLAHAVHQIPQAGQPLGVGAIDALPEEPTQGIHQVAVAHELIGHRAHEIFGAEVIDLLGAIPAGIASAVSGECHEVRS